MKMAKYYIHDILDGEHIDKVAALELECEEDENGLYVTTEEESEWLELFVLGLVTAEEQGLRSSDWSTDDLYYLGLAILADELND